MPLRLTDLGKNTVDVSFAFAGETVTVSYRPALLTPLRKLSLLAGSRAYRADGDDPALMEMIHGWREYYADLAAVVAGWDVLGEDGKPVAPTAELFGRLDGAFTAALVEALVTDQTVDPQNGRGSGATSTRKA